MSNSVGCSGCPYPSPLPFMQVLDSLLPVQKAVVAVIKISLVISDMCFPSNMAASDMPVYPLTPPFHRSACFTSQNLWANVFTMTAKRSPKHPRKTKPNSLVCVTFRFAHLKLLSYKRTLMSHHGVLLPTVYRIYSINRPGRLFNFGSMRVGACYFPNIFSRRGQF